MGKSDYRIEAHYVARDRIDAHYEELDRIATQEAETNNLSSSELATIIGLGEYYGFVDLIIPGSHHDDGTNITEITTPTTDILPVGVAVDWYIEGMEGQTSIPDQVRESLEFHARQGDADVIELLG